MRRRVKDGHKSVADLRKPQYCSGGGSSGCEVVDPEINDLEHRRSDIGADRHETIALYFPRTWLAHSPTSKLSVPLTALPRTPSRCTRVRLNSRPTSRSAHLTNAWPRKSPRLPVEFRCWHFSLSKSSRTNPRNAAGPSHPSKRMTNPGGELHRTQRGSYQLQNQPRSEAT